MKIVMIGIGIVVTEFLSNERHDVNIIDKNLTLIEECIDVYDVEGIVGKWCES
ncbi:MAG: hypothetical protein PHY42_06770 [Bacilli bacterium]|nr:hypothetical protein [Bacilli bacterium]